MNGFEFRSHDPPGVHRPDSRTGIEAILLQPVEPFRLPRPGDLVGPAYRLERVALTGRQPHPEGRGKQIRNLLSDWSELSEARALDPPLLARVVRVLLETRPARPAERLHLPPLDPGEDKRRFRPTAAHPRGYRGTRDRPPKPRLPGAYDLRLWLASPGGSDRVLRRLSHHWPKARAILERDGYDRERLSRIEFPERGPLDPSWQYHHGDGGAAPPAMPSLFSTQLLPLLRGEDAGVLRGALASFRRLQLESDPDLLAHVLALRVRSATAAPFLQWCRLLERRAPGRRLALATLLARWEGVAAGVRRISGEDLQLLDSCPDTLYGHRLSYFLEAVERRVPRSYVFGGFHLADSFQPDHAFESHGASGEGLDAGVIGDLCRRLLSGKPADDPRRDSAMSLWEQCGRLPGLCEVLKAIPWRSEVPEMAWSFLDMVLDMRLGDPGKWALLRPVIPRLHSELLQVGERYRRKYLDSLTDIHLHWGKSARMRTALPTLHRLAARLARPPFGTDNHAAQALCLLACCATREELQSLEEAPDSSLMKIEEACRRGNDGSLIADGLFELNHDLRAFALSCFRRFPAELCRAARTLGSLSSPRQKQVLAGFKKHPVMAAEWEKMKPSGAFQLLEPLIAEGVTSPMPRKLRDHVRGARRLTAAQVERCMSVLRSEVPRLQLRVLESLAEKELSRGFPVKSLKDHERHALRMLPGLDSNRRSFRRFLAAHFRGQGDFLHQHPSSRRWFASHLRINRAAWQAGLTLERELEGVGHVRIAVERDPLEALKLGTYVGSCLGLGGMSSYSAAAVVLDVNKQVLYARDRKGSVLARQLVAISEADELVCFKIYPESASRGLKRFFREYDGELARFLGIEIYSPSTAGEHYDVALVLARDWWDDGAWDFTTARPSSGARGTSGPRPAPAGRGGRG